MPNPDVLYYAHLALMERLRAEAEHARLAHLVRGSAPRRHGLAAGLTAALAGLRTAWPTARLRHHHRPVEL